MCTPDLSYYLFDRHGSAIATEEQYAKAATGLRRVGDEAAKRGILLALESHNCYLHDTIPSCRKLMELTNHPSVGINYDQGNILLNSKGGTIDDAFRELDGKIYYAHLKNMLLTQDCQYMQFNL